VKFINTDGLAFIGPGSEWFWTAVSGLILAITFFAIYRQLRIQRDAAAIEQSTNLIREWTSEAMLRAALEVFLAFDAGTDPAELPRAPVARIGDFLSGVGMLTQRGHMDRRLVWVSLSLQIQQWWVRLSPMLQVWRVAEGQALWSEFEWLARTMAEMDAKSGQAQRFDLDALKPHLGETIADTRHWIEDAEALRTVPVRLVSFPAAAIGQPLDPTRG
jgi:hypothetical protein